MVNFGLVLGCQISEAKKVNAAKLTTECVIGSALFGCFFGLLAANLAISSVQKEHATYQPQSYCFSFHNNGILEAKKTKLNLPIAPFCFSKTLSISPKSSILPWLNPGTVGINAIPTLCLVRSLSDCCPFDVRLFIRQILDK
jgi:hypothetical protein